MRELKNALIPMIRKVVPKLMAQEILGVQLMIPSIPYVLVPNKVGAPNDGHVTVFTNPAISAWIQEQAIYEWKFDDMTRNVFYPIGLTDRFIISKELYTLLVLKWS